MSDCRILSFSVCLNLFLVVNGVQQTCESEWAMHTLDMGEAVYSARLGLKCVQMPSTEQDTELQHQPQSEAVG